MNVRTLKDSVGAVFSPKVSADSVYLSGSETNLTTKLNNIDSLDSLEYTFERDMKRFIRAV